MTISSSRSPGRAAISGDNLRASARMSSVSAPHSVADDGSGALKLRAIPPRRSVTSSAARSSDICGSTRANSPNPSKAIWSGCTALMWNSRISPVASVNSARSSEAVGEGRGEISAHAPSAKIADKTKQILGAGGVALRSADSNGCIPRIGCGLSRQRFEAMNSWQACLELASPKIGNLSRLPIFGAICSPVVRALCLVVEQHETEATRYRIGFGQLDVDLVAKRVLSAGPPTDQAMPPLVVIIVVARQAVHRHKAIGTSLGKRHEEARAGDAIDARSLLSVASASLPGSASAAIKPR